MKKSECGGIAPPFFASALDGGEWSASHPGRFISVQRTGDRLGPKSGVNAVE
jgi:hypothetical protein